MLLTSHPKPPDRFGLELSSTKSEELAYVGPSMQGWIYRSVSTHACFRLIPIRGSNDAQESQAGGAPPCFDDAPWERRHEIRAWIGTPRQRGVAPIVAAEPCTIEGHQYFYVHYEVDGAINLCDQLHKADRRASLLLAITALKALPGWWEQLYPGLFPMPADIVLPHTEAWLLALPMRRRPALPDWSTVLTEPLRAHYLAPDVLSGRQALQGDLLDRYALGMALWPCFFKLPERGGVSPVQVAGNILSRAVNRSALALERQKSDLPFWMQRVDASKTAIAEVRLLLGSAPADGEPMPPLRQSAERLARCLHDMDPVNAVQWLLHTDRKQEAFDLLQDILLEDDSYEHLFLAGEIAGGFLARHLEAGELYEKAIERAPERTKAYESQLISLIQGREDLEKALAKAGSRGDTEMASVFRQLDERILRDIEKLPRHGRERHEAAVARHLLKRGRALDAANFIYKPLIEGQPGVWWKFDLACVYIDCWMSLGEWDKAHQQFVYTRWKLEEAKQQPDAFQDTLEGYAVLLDELEETIFQARSRAQTGGTP